MIRFTDLACLYSSCAAAISPLRGHMHGALTEGKGNRSPILGLRCRIQTTSQLFLTEEQRVQSHTQDEAQLCGSVGKARTRAWAANKAVSYPQKTNIA